MSWRETKKGFSEGFGGGKLSRELCNYSIISKIKTNTFLKFCESS